MMALPCLGLPTRPLSYSIEWSGLKIESLSMARASAHSGGKRVQVMSILWSMTWRGLIRYDLSSSPVLHLRQGRLIIQLQTQSAPSYEIFFVGAGGQNGRTTRRKS